MSQDTKQTLLLILAFVGFIVIHTTFRFALDQTTSVRLYEGLSYLQFFLYGSLFIIGLSWIVMKRFKHYLDSSRPNKREELLKMTRRLTWIHRFSYGYYGLLVVFYILSLDVDIQSVYHYVAYLVMALLSAYLVSKYQNQNPFVMDR